MTLSELRWQLHSFDTLDTHALFELLKLRVDVFVVEQACAYPELDAHDTAPETLHLLGYTANELVAYARAMPPETQPSCVSDRRTKIANPSVCIGRVVVAKKYRGCGIAQSLMQQLIEHIQVTYPQLDQVLAAQTSVQGFYTAMGFKPGSNVYMEDGIEHIDMRRQYAPLIIRC